MKSFILKCLGNPKFRYSGLFLALQELLTFYPYEETIKNSIDFIANCKIKGDYLEFGVWRGNHFTATYKFAEKWKLDDMRFFAFDSFEGLPEISGLDMDAPKQFEKGEYSCDVDTFKEIIQKNGVALDRVSITEGWFDKTLNEKTKERLKISKAAIIWIDCDFYESTVPCLDFVTEYIQDGTVIIFDDWFCFNGNPEFGQQRAFREWLERNSGITASDFYKYGWTGNSFILNKKEPSRVA